VNENEEWGRRKREEKKDKDCGRRKRRGGEG
jgi:hypothetical protein